MLFAAALCAHSATAVLDVVMSMLQILMFNLPVNFAQGTSIFWAYVIGFHESPLTAIQVLYVNLVTVSHPRASPG
jgi:magnesium-transporting ATPase (P-type)